MSTSPTTSPVPASYPATLSVEYPDRNLDRLTSFFRIFVIIPIGIVFCLMSDPTINWGTHTDNWRMNMAAGGLLFLPLVLMILFRNKYPRWWFDWNLAFSRFTYRVGAYFLLLRDEYPSTDEEQAVHLGLVYPDMQMLSRGMPLVKWFLAIPHYFVLAVLAIGVFVVWIIAWFAILFTGRYPRGMYDFTVGVLRWGLRVSAYAFLLITDKYPDFSLEP
jgi:hypothetical protein